MTRNTKKTTPAAKKKSNRNDPYDFETQAPTEKKQTKPKKQVIKSANKTTKPHAEKQKPKQQQPEKISKPPAKTRRSAVKGQVSFSHVEKKLKTWIQQRLLTVLATMTKHSRKRSPLESIERHICDNKYKNWHDFETHAEECGLTAKQQQILQEEKAKYAQKEQELQVKLTKAVKVVQQEACQIDELFQEVKSFAFEEQSKQTKVEPSRRTIRTLAIPEELCSVTFEDFFDELA